MIRIRKKDKSVITLPSDAMFVELVDDYGEVLQVFCENKLEHSFNYFGWPSEKAIRYSKVFGVPFVKEHHTLEIIEPNDKNKLIIEK